MYNGGDTYWITDQRAVIGQYSQNAEGNIVFFILKLCAVNCTDFWAKKYFWSANNIKSALTLRGVAGMNPNIQSVTDIGVNVAKLRVAKTAEISAYSLN